MYEYSSKQTHAVIHLCVYATDSFVLVFRPRNHRPGSLPIISAFARTRNPMSSPPQQNGTEKGSDDPSEPFQMSRGVYCLFGVFFEDTDETTCWISADLVTNPSIPRCNFQIFVIIAPPCTSARTLSIRIQTLSPANACCSNNPWHHYPWKAITVIWRQSRPASDIVVTFYFWKIHSTGPNT